MREYGRIREANKKVYFIRLKDDKISEDILKSPMIQDIHVDQFFVLPKPNERKRLSDSLENSMH
jgi:hypothetical protein